MVGASSALAFDLTSTLAVTLTQHQNMMHAMSHLLNILIFHGELHKSGNVY